MSNIVVSTQIPTKRGEIYTMYIRYQPMFPFEETLQFEPETKLVKILSQIDLSEICSKLPKPSNFGPKVRNREAMLYSLIAMKI